MKKILFLLYLTSSLCHAADQQAARQDELRQLMKNDCGACHGLTRQGGMGPALLPATLASKSDDVLIETILNGRKGTAMPPWKFMLNHDDVAWIVQQLRIVP